MDFSNINIDQLFGMGEESNPLMMLVWILPIILFVFYGQRIQLYVTSGEIKKSIKKLDAYRTESRDELLDYVKCVVKKEEYDQNIREKITRFVDYFTIMPVDTDPAGIMSRIRHVVRTSEDVTRSQVAGLLGESAGHTQESRVQTLLEIASTLQMVHKTVNHMFLTAKKQNNYPLILPLQMILPFVMEQAEAMRDAIYGFKKGLPIGDGIGPMAAGIMMARNCTGAKEHSAVLHTTLAKGVFEGRSLIIIKPTGPASVVGRPADAIHHIVQQWSMAIDVIIMIDAALKMEGEDSAGISQGFGAAIGGIGTERYEIEKYASGAGIPVLSIIIKESVREAITPMTEEIAQKSDEIIDRTYDMIRDNTSRGQTVVVIGVGNTAGVAQ